MLDGSLVYCWCDAAALGHGRSGTFGVEYDNQNACHKKAMGWATLCL
jgi:hypothetical protein